MGEARRKRVAEAAGIEIPHRKFMSEFAVSLCSARWMAITPDQIASGSSMTREEKELSAACHIYAICSRPAQRIDPASFTFSEGHISGTVVFRVKGVEQRISFSSPFQLSDGATAITLPYPHREIITTDSGGRAVRYLPVSALSLLGLIKNEHLKNLEVLYIGQAFGDGSRSALERLKSHSTLQKILADTHYASPDDELQVLTFEYVPYRIFMNFDGIDRTAIRDERDTRRASRLFKDPLTLKQQICLAEAGLIRYFEPRYNVIYKDSFPAEDQKILTQCYRLDFSALVVEVNTDERPIALFSERRPASQHHIARFDLVDPKQRRSFFTFVGRDGRAATFPGAIPPNE